MGRAEQPGEPVSSLCKGTGRAWGQHGWKDDKCLLEAMDVTSNVSQSSSKCQWEKITQVMHLASKSQLFGLLRKHDLFGQYR